jgi:hypothetical protein
MVYLQTTYELCFGEAYFEYFESCDFLADMICFVQRVTHNASLTDRF